MKTCFNPLALLILLAFLHACTFPSASSTEARSTLRRLTSPTVDAASAQQLTAGNTAFALDVYQALKSPDGNFIYSPYSISLALAMTYAGARGNTERQMAQVLHFDLPQTTLHPAFNALDLDLTARADGKKDNFELNIANSLWGQQDYAFEQAFLDTLAANYGAGLRLVNFAAAPEPARATINQWVSDQTKARIKDLIPEGAITGDTRLVLANAIYFNAKWRYPFSHEGTRDGTFYTLNGETVTVPMMRLQRPAVFSYAQGPGYQAVELPYKGEQMAMLIILPDAGTFASFEAGLNRAGLDALLAALQPHTVQLTLPKFQFETAFGLEGVLAGMGMPDAFDARAADFSGIRSEKDLFISAVIHKAFVAVDEEGTEAAAATSVLMETAGAILSDVVLLVDHPFLFFIRDTATGTILFAGRVTDPAP